jgi:hypothetical protein
MNCKSKKLTAVEQFTLALIKAKAIKPSATKDFVKSNIDALAVEKEQIKNAFTKGDLFAEDYFNPKIPNVDCSENYYNETFKSE